MNPYTAAILTTLTAALLMASDADKMLEAARQKETLEGDLAGAIKQYNAIVAKFSKTDRSAAAMALVHMAECHQKLGDEEAKKVYDRVVREYGDQREAVAMARAHLSITQQPGRQSNTLVWTRDKLNASPTVSYDGRYISFIDLDTGDVALHEIATGLDRHLTNNPKGSGERGYGAIVSRDGKLTVYNWWNNKEKVYEIRLVNTTGVPNPRRLYANRDIDWMNLYDWSPDNKLVTVQFQRQDQTRQIGLLSVPDGTLRVLKSLDWRGASRIWFSPDGKYVGYDLPQNETDFEADVFVLSVDGAREIRTVVHPGNDAMMGWSPDGKWLLFASDRTGSTGVWGVPFADGKVAGAPELLKADLPARAQSIGITSRGALYYGIWGGQARSKIQIVDVDFATGESLAAPTNVAQDYVESNASPDWSPDGRQLAYISLRGRHNVMMIRSMDTGQVRELRPSLSYFGSTKWAPDRRAFLTLGGDLKGRAGIFQIDAETGAASTLLLDQPGERSGYPSWARDGKSFYFRRNFRKTKDNAYIRRDLVTGKETELIRRPVLAQADRISPDGRYFATRGIDEPTNSRTLLIIPTAGGEAREIMRWPSEVPAADLADWEKGVWFAPGAWAPDGRSVLASKVRGSETLGTWRIPIDGSEPRRLNGFKLDPNLAPPALSPDGRRLAFTVTETTPKHDPEIWALDNFLPKEK
jgi:Tol biopolymer transport system component